MANCPKCGSDNLRVFSKSETCYRVDGDDLIYSNGGDDNLGDDIECFDCDAQLNDHFEVNWDSDLADPKLITINKEGDDHDV